MDEAYSSAYQPVVDREGRPPGAVETELPGGTGMVTFAGLVLCVIGIINTIYGVAAIADSSYFDHGADYVLSGLTSYGWIVLIIGVTQVCAGFGIWRGAQWARWLGVTTASLNAIAQILWLPSYPLAALAVFSVDLIVLYALLMYGSPRPAGAAS